MGRLSGWKMSAAVRTTVATALILAMSGIQWVRIEEGCSVVFLIDRSKSITSSELDRAVAFVNEEIEQHRREHRRDRVGVISFARDAAVEVPPVPDDVHISRRFETDLVLEETNLAAALRLAQSILSDHSARRIVVLSDGNVTRGDVQGVAARIAHSGIGMDVVALSGEGAAEVAVTKVSIPTTVRKESPFEIRVAVSNRVPEGRPCDGGRGGPDGNAARFRRARDHRAPTCGAR